MTYIAHLYCHFSNANPAVLHDGNYRLTHNRSAANCVTSRYKRYFRVTLSLLLLIMLFSASAAANAQGMATSTRSDASNGQFTAGAITTTVTVTSRTGSMDSQAGILSGVYVNEEIEANFPGQDPGDSPYWYSTTVAGTDFRGFQTHLTGGTTGTMTIRFDFNTDVTNPIFHIYNADGALLNFASTLNTSGAQATLSKLSGNNELEINTSTRIVNGTNNVAVNWGCESNAGANGNGGCGSIQFVGTYRSITAVISTNGNDGFGIALFFPADYGDAPASYGIAGHNSVGATNPLMGNTTIDYENGMQSSDDTTGSDDETIAISALTQSGTSTLTIPIFQGSGKYLNAWFDWNGDGDFADAGEQVATNIVDGGVGDTSALTGTIGFPITVPANAATTATWARFRFSSFSGITSASLVADGEVEDHQITVARPAVDLSLTKTVNNATPNAGTNVIYTLTATNSASALNTSTGITVRDILPAGMAFVSASGAGAYISATGIWTVGSLAPGASASLTITATSSYTSNITIQNIAEIITATGIDPDSTINNGVTTEDDYATVSIITQAPTYNCPIGTTATGSGYAPTGSGIYLNQIFWLDWSCGSTTTFASASTINKSWNAGDGLVITGQVTGATTALSPYVTGTWGGDTLDDLYQSLNPIGLRNANDGEDPQYTIQLSAALNGISVPIRIATADAEDTGFLTESMSITTNGTPWTLLEQTGTITLSGVGSQTANWTDVPQTGGGTPVLETSGTTVRINATIFAGGTQALAFGIFTPFDQSDAPLTGTTYGAARHRTVTALRLGPSFTTENTPYDSPNASGDVDNGVTIPATVVISQSNNIDVAIAGPGYLSAWLDWNDDGDFADAGEKIANDIVDGGTGDVDATVNGVIRVAVTVPSVAATPLTISRFRFSSTSGAAPSGQAGFGEVEDYPIAIAGNAVLTAVKTSTPYNDGINPVLNLPGQDVVYSIVVTNTASGTTTTDSILYSTPCPLK